jgi:hypothetical protein
MALNTRKSQDMDTKTLASNVDRYCGAIQEMTKQNTVVEKALQVQRN